MFNKIQFKSIHFKTGDQDGRCIITVVVRPLFGYWPSTVYGFEGLPGNWVDLFTNKTLDRWSRLCKETDRYYYQQSYEDVF